MLRRISVAGPETIYLDRVTTIGSGNCDLSIQDPGLEAQHAIIEASSEPSGSKRFWIRDLGSATGVSINGTNFYGESVELKPGDKIGIGYELEYEFQAYPLTSANRRVWSGGGRNNRFSNGFPQLSHRRNPSPTPRLIEIETRETVPRPVTGAQQSFGAYRQRNLLRHESLDRVHRRRRVAPSAWANEKVAFSATSPSSSGSWDSENKHRALFGNNTEEPTIRHLQSRIYELEAMVNEMGSREAGMGVDDSRFQHDSQVQQQLLARIKRLQAKLIERDLSNNQLTHLNSSYSREMGTDPISLRSDFEKAELELRLAKAEEILRERESTIAALVQDKHIGLPKRENSSDSFMSVNSFSTGLQKQRRQSGESETFGKSQEWGISHEDSGSTSKANLQKELKEKSEEKEELELVQEVDGIVRTLLTDEVRVLLEGEEGRAQDALPEKLYERLKARQWSSVEDKLVDYETKVREKLSDKLLHSERQEPLAQKITETLNRSWKPALEVAAALAPIIQDLLAEFQKYLILRSQFQSWSVNFREEVSQNGLSSSRLLEMGEHLLRQFEASGAGDSWFLSSFLPILRGAAKQLQDLVENKHNVRDQEMSTELSMQDIALEEKQKREMNVEMEKRNESLEQIRKELRVTIEEKNVLSVDSAELKEKNNELETELAVIRGTREASLEENEQLMSRIQRLELENSNSAQESRDLIDKIGAVEEAKGEKDEEINRLETELNTVRNELESAKLKLDQPDTAADDVEVLKEKLEEVKLTKENGIQLTNKLTEQISELQQKLDDFELLEAELNRKVMELNRDNEELRRHQQLNSDMNVQELKMRLKENEERNSHMSQELFQAKEELESALSAREPTGEENLSDRPADQPFWDFSQRLANMLELDLKKKDAEEPEDKDERVETMEELAKGVQELLDRVRKQNQELDTHRSDTSDPPFEDVSALHNGQTQSGQGTASSLRKARRERRRKQDLPMKVVTFDLPRSNDGKPFP